MVLNAAAARLGQSLRETEDELVRDMLAGTASVVNCVNGTNGDNPTELTDTDINAVVQTLQSNDADFISSMKEGVDAFGTGPVLDAYFAMGHSDLITELRAVNGFIEKAQYPNQKGVSSAEWGSVGNVRFMLSSRGSVSTGSSLLTADIFNIFVTGNEAYGIIEQTSASAAFIYHPPGSGDDPAELRQTAATRFAQVPRITNDSWVFNLRCTAA